MSPNTCFTNFKESIEDIVLPEKFTFPFYYTPHPLALQAATELQERIQHEIEWEHDFGLGTEISDQALGKMFGVLVVRKASGELGYLSAFSGKLEEKNLEKIFVPSIYNRFDPRDHFVVEAEKLDQLSQTINHLEANPTLSLARQDLFNKEQEVKRLLDIEKKKLKKWSRARKSAREKVRNEMGESAYNELHKKHKQESINDTFLYDEYEEYLQNKLDKYRQDYHKLNKQIESLKAERKAKSNTLQDWLFAQYNFLNARGETKNVISLFENRIPNIPPSGSGDCAAPKLLQYAYQNQLQPISMAEFWWGKEPSSKVRKHKYFYPACRGKCEPILNFMMDGLMVDDNPLLANLAMGKTIKTVYEDDHLVVINKPAEFLSVPGKHVSDSVQERMLKKYPNATGPMIVHRLDMSTSGLMVVAKTKLVHRVLQQAFKIRNVTKKYIALLDGVVEEDTGYIDLPLRLDIDNRPFQLVCYEHGKPCRTKWEVVQRNKTTTKVHFYPLSGRTHQLRVHAAHRDGLGAPIVGDDLYGLKKDRLYLHAASLSFTHPVTGVIVEVDAAAEF